MYTCTINVHTSNSTCSVCIYTVYVCIQGIRKGRKGPQFEGERERVRVKGNRRKVERKGESDREKGAWK